MKAILVIMLALSYSPVKAAEPPLNNVVKNFSQLGEEPQKHCWGKLCVETSNSTLPDMFSRPDKTDRMRLKDPHSGFDGDFNSRPKASFSYTWDDE
jgi:hypothetical protein